MTQPKTKIWGNDSNISFTQKEITGRLYFLNCKVIRIRGCKFTKPLRNSIQFDKCTDCLVEWCEIQAGENKVEDIVSIFQSKRVTIANCWIEGGRSIEGSSSGALIDKGCGLCAIKDTTFINTPNIAAGIAGGVDNSLVFCRAHSNRTRSNNVGFYIDNQYPKNDFAGNFMVGCGSHWFNSKGRNDFYWPGVQHRTIDTGWTIGKLKAAKAAWNKARKEAMEL